MVTVDLKADLSYVATVRLFFGHQSVGKDILDGTVDIFQSTGMKEFPVLEVRGTGELPDAFIVHSSIGKNREPKTKCDDFRRAIDEDLGDEINYAMLKFCYVDIDEETDVDALFSYYKAVIDVLKAKHPNIMFIHATVPLRHTPSGFSVWLREALGRPNRSKLANIKRNELNRLLRKAYVGEPVFDLAAAESTYPDGSRESFRCGGGLYFSLIGEYSDDGGHLNSLGRRQAATEFVKTIARAARVRQAGA